MAISLSKYKSIANSIDVRQEETTVNNPCYIVDKKLIDSIIKNTNTVDEDHIRNTIANIAHSNLDIAETFAQIKDYIYMVETIDAIRSETIKYEDNNKYISPVE